jgi:hypothetical protein
MYPQIPLRFRGNNRGFRQTVATGGTIFDPPELGGFRYHSFISSGTFTVTTRGSIEYLIIGGGGGGGNNGVGGGAGAAIQEAGFLEAGSYSVTVGSGGRGADGRAFDTGQGRPTGPNFSSSPGLPSIFLGLTANGGIGGNEGGTSGNGFTRGFATCGGGAGGSAANGSGYTGGNGVNLPDWSSATGTGVSGYYSGGGGGSGQNCAATFGFGGLGGGGRGARGSGGDEDLRQDSPEPGVPRTGSGGGAGFNGPESFIRAGASGGSGIVIMRYRMYKPI